MVRFLLLLGMSIITYAGLLCMNFIVISKFRPDFLSWLKAALIFSPWIILSQIPFWFIYYYGYEWYKKMWIPYLAILVGPILAGLVITYLWYGEFPTKGSLLGLIFLIGALLSAILWK